jgi:hypothetical protein
MSLNAANLAAVFVPRDALGNEVKHGDLVAVSMLYGRSSGHQVIGWVWRLPQRDGGKFIVKHLDKPSSPGNPGISQPYFNSYKVVRITDVPYQYRPDKMRADIDDN